MAAVVGVISRCGLSIDACHRNQTNRSNTDVHNIFLYLNFRINLYITRITPEHNGPCPNSVSYDYIIKCEHF